MMIRAMLLRLPDTVDVALVLYPFLSVRDFMVACAMTCTLNARRKTA